MRKIAEVMGLPFVAQGDLFGLAEVASGPARSPRRDLHQSHYKRLRVAPARWNLEPHVCRHCMGGRVVSSVAAGVHTWLCTNCGATAEAETAESICCCGIRMHRPDQAGVIDPGIRCQPNPRPTPEFPSLIVAADVQKD